MDRRSLSQVGHSDGVRKLGVTDYTTLISQGNTKTWGVKETLLGHSIQLIEFQNGIRAPCGSAPAELFTQLSSPFRSPPVPLWKKDSE